jgi:transposase-like protein
MKYKKSYMGVFYMSKSMKGIASTDKVKLVERYLNGEVSITVAAKDIGVNKKTVSLWVQLYKIGGPTALRPQKKNQHYSKELKLKAVTEYLNGNGSLNVICEKYYIRSSFQLRQWIKLYNNHETFKSESGGSYMRKTRETDLEERLKIVQECLINNKNYGAMALKYKVSYQQVRNWVMKYEEMGSAGLDDRRGRRTGTQPSRTPEEELRDKIAQLEREKRDLQMENDLLKKVRELERRDRLL